MFSNNKTGKLLLPIFTLSLFANKSFSTSFECYSCASTLFEPLWHGGEGVPYPRQWTNDCHRDPASHNIQKVLCENSKCFVQRVKKIADGKVQSEGTIRGCWSRLFHFAPLTDTNDCIDLDLADGKTTACYCEGQLCNTKCLDETDCYPSSPSTKHPGKQSCMEWSSSGQSANGIYPLTISGQTFNVFCDMDDGGWIVVQRRLDGTVDFDREWNDYLNGFPALIQGEKIGSFWLGLEKIHLITAARQTEMTIVVYDCFKRPSAVYYETFELKDSSTNYTMHVSKGSGSAGDSFNAEGYDPAFAENDMQFSTKDNPNDKLPHYNCAQFYRGGWWFNKCGIANLNGIYYKDCQYTSVFSNGIIWSTWKQSSYSAWKAVMKIRWKI